MSLSRSSVPWSHRRCSLLWNKCALVRLTGAWRLELLWVQILLRAFFLLRLLVVRGGIGFFGWYWLFALSFDEKIEASLASYRGDGLGLFPFAWSRLLFCLR